MRNCGKGADLIYVGGSSSKFLSSTYVYVSAFVGTFLSLRPFYTIERDAQVSERLAVEDLIHQYSHNYVANDRQCTVSYCSCADSACGGM